MTYIGVGTIIWAWISLLLTAHFYIGTTWALADVGTYLDLWFVGWFLLIWIGVPILAAVVLAVGIGVPMWVWGTRY